MSTRRDVWSLLIFMHLFCVVVGLFGQESSSELTTRLTSVLGPYLRLVNITSPAMPEFQLTHAMEYEDDHQLEVEITDESSAGMESWPPGKRSGALDLFGFRQRRALNLAREFGMRVTGEDEHSVAELTRAVGASVLSKTGASGLVLRCRRLAPLPRDATVPRGEDAVIYEADVWMDDIGVVRVHKRVEIRESAPVVPQN